MQNLFPLVSNPDLASLVIRVLVGTFYVLYRFRWFYDPSQPDPWFSQYRKQLLEARLCSCHYPQSYAMCAFLASVEVLAGLGILFGFMTVWAAGGLLIVMLFATYCTAWENTEPQHPVDRLDIVSCYLRTIEPLYITMLLALVLLGPGRWSLDAAIWAYMGW